MSQEQTGELDQELGRHQNRTKTLVKAVLDGNLLSPEDVLDILRDPGNERKSARIFTAMCRQMYRTGRTLIETYRLFQEHKVPILVPGIVPPNDPAQLHGLAIRLADDVVFEVQTRVLPNSGAVVRIPLERGKKGRINLLLIPFKKVGIDTFYHARVEFLMADSRPWGMELTWEDIEIDWDTDPLYQTS